MTKVIKSQTSNKKYFLTIEDKGAAIDCSCPDRQYRGHACKHMTAYHHELNRVTMFKMLQARFDVRSQVVIEEKRAAYWNFEMALGY